MNRFEDIRGNEAVIEKLKETIDSREAIAFVGAGASAGHYPLWNELINRLAKEALDRDKVDQAGYDYWIKQASNRPHQVVRGIRDKLGANLFGQSIREIFRPRVGPNGNKFTETHEKLLKIPFKGYVTTNYDPINSKTNIYFTLPGRDYVSLKLYTPTGREVTTRANGFMGAGNHEISWNGKGFNSGVYFVKLETSRGVSGRSVVLVR